MGILNKKEEKIQAVLGRLPEKYTHAQFVEQFIKNFSKDWGKIKTAYVRQAQDKEPGTVINMPKPEAYLKQIHDQYVKARESVEVLKEKAAELRADAAKQVTEAHLVQEQNNLPPEAELVAVKATVDPMKIEKPIRIPGKKVFKEDDLSKVGAKVAPVKKTAKAPAEPKAKKDIKK